MAVNIGGGRAEAGGAGLRSPVSISITLQTIYSSSAESSSSTDSPSWSEAGQSFIVAIIRYSLDHGLHGICHDCCFCCCRHCLDFHTHTRETEREGGRGRMSIKVIVDLRLFIYFISAERMNSLSSNQHSPPYSAAGSHSQVITYASTQVAQTN